LELGIVEGQADRDDLGQQVNGSKSTMVIVDVVYVDIRVTVDRCGNSLIPSRIEDSRRQVVHTSRIRVSLGLSTEDRRIQNDVGDVFQDVFLDLDEVRFSEDDDLDRLDSLARGILEILDFGDDPNQIDVRHRFTHQTRHDTETSNLDLELPVDNFVFERRDQNLSSLVLVLRPTDDLRLLVARKTEYLFDGSAVVVVLLADRSISLRDDTELVVFDAVVGEHENLGGNDGSDGGDKEKTIKGSARGLVASRLNAPSHRRVIHNQGP